VKQGVESGLTLSQFNFTYEGPAEICPKGQFILADAQSITAALDLACQGVEDHFVPWFSHGTNVSAYTLLCTRFYGAKSH